MKPSGFGNRTLINDKPILVLPELAKKVGLNEAIVLQQLHYWLINAERANRNYKDGKYWIYNTYAEWQEQFPWWSVRTIRRIFTGLEEEELILTANYNKMPIDKTKWYTINYQKIDDIFNTTDKNGRPCGQSGQTDSPKWTHL